MPLYKPFSLKNTRTFSFPKPICLRFFKEESDYENIDQPRYQVYHSPHTSTQFLSYVEASSQINFIVVDADGVEYICANPTTSCILNCGRSFKNSFPFSSQPYGIVYGCYISNFKQHKIISLFIYFKYMQIYPEYLIQSLFCNCRCFMKMMEQRKTCKILVQQSLEITSLLEATENSRLSNKLKKLLGTIILVRIWFIQRATNEAKFNNKRRNLIMVFDLVTSYGRNLR